MRDLYLSWTIERRTLSEGVISPAPISKSRSSSAIFLILS